MIQLKHAQTRARVEHVSPRRNAIVDPKKCRNYAGRGPNGLTVPARMARLMTEAWAGRYGLRRGSRHSADGRTLLHGSGAGWDNKDIWRLCKHNASRSIYICTRHIPMTGVECTLGTTLSRPLEAIRQLLGRLTCLCVSWGEGANARHSSGLPVRHNALRFFCLLLAST